MPLYCQRYKAEYKSGSWEAMVLCRVVIDIQALFVADENTERKLTDKVRFAKKEGLIDNFIYGFVSATYLSAVIDTL